MSQNVLEVLKDRPQDVFKYCSNNKQEAVSFFKNLMKEYLDPVSKQYSVLDEIYVDGLDSTQVYGQAKIVLEGVGESLLYDKIPRLRKIYGEKEEVNSSDELEAGNNIDSQDSDDEEEDALESHVEDSQKDEANASNDASDKSGTDISESGDSDLEQYSDAESHLSDADTLVNRDGNATAGNDNSGSTREISAPKKDVFGLNDEFFDIDEFNRQTLALEENDGANSEEEELDYFGELSEGDDDSIAYFDDFYDDPQTQSEKLTNSPVAEEESSEFQDKDYGNAIDSAMLDMFADEDEDESKPATQTKNVSSFEKQQQQIQAEIAKLEAELVAEKKWTMKGEVSSKQRPQDSLLNDPDSVDLGFDRTAKPVPVITDEVAESIEDLIRRRVKSEEFDDLPRRIMNDVSSFSNKQKTELNEQKSSKSLAEIYENEFQNHDTQQEVDEELQKQHDEITNLFTAVNHKLDSLTSAHFIPKPHQVKSIEVKVNDAAASINMEDAQPLHISDDKKLAPQEIYKIGDDRTLPDGSKVRSEVALKSGLSYSKDELSKEDKTRLRRALKRKRSKHFKAKNEREEQKQAQAKDKGQDSNKRQKVGQVMDTLSKAKNITVIDKKGDLKDIRGNEKKFAGQKGSSAFML